MLEGRESAVWSRSSFLHAETADLLFLRVKAFQFFCMQSKIRVVFPFLVIPAIKALNCGGFLREKLKRGREKPAPTKLCLGPRFSKTMPWGGTTTTSKSGGTRRMHNAVVQRSSIMKMARKRSRTCANRHDQIWKDNTAQWPAACQDSYPSVASTTRVTRLHY